MWIDSHCHVTADRFAEDRDEVIERADRAGVHTLVAIGAGYGADGNAAAVVTTEGRAKELSADPSIPIQVISYGYAREYHVEKYLRDSKIIQLWLGGAQLGRLDVAQGYYPYVEGS